MKTIAEPGMVEPIKDNMWTFTIIVCGIKLQSTESFFSAVVCKEKMRLTVKMMNDQLAPGRT